MATAPNRPTFPERLIARWFSLMEDEQPDQAAGVMGLIDELSDDDWARVPEADREGFAEWLAEQREHVPWHDLDDEARDLLGTWIERLENAGDFDPRPAPTPWLARVLERSHALEQEPWNDDAQAGVFSLAVRARADEWLACVAANPALPGGQTFFHALVAVMANGQCEDPNLLFDAFVAARRLGQDPNAPDAAGQRPMDRAAGMFLAAGFLLAVGANLETAAAQGIPIRALLQPEDPGYAALQSRLTENGLQQALPEGPLAPHPRPPRL